MRIALRFNQAVYKHVGGGKKQAYFESSKRRSLTTHLKSMDGSFHPFYPLKIDALFIISRVPSSGYIFRFTFRLLSDVSYSDECRTKKAFSMPQECSINIYIYKQIYGSTLVRSQVVANFNFLLVFLSIISTFPFAPKKEKSWLLASY